MPAEKFVRDKKLNSGKIEMLAREWGQLALTRMGWSEDAL